MTTLLLPADTKGVAQAAAVLREGGLVAFPTETVYGLGADATSGSAVASLYAAKERPRFNPLIAHVPGLREAERLGRLDATARRLVEAFWPGPLTVVVPVAEDTAVCGLARAGLDSVGLRVPDHPVALALLRAVARPIAAPSANRSGRISPTSAAHVRADLEGRIAMILDGGRCAVGVESTILGCLGEPTLLRPGGVPREAIETVLGRRLAEPRAGDGGPIAPGQLASHYAPRARLRLDARDAAPGEAVLDFGGALAAFRTEGAYRDLAADGDLRVAAATLFAALRDLDRMGAAAIAVAPVPDVGLGAAINDRLARAAAPRD